MAYNIASPFSFPHARIHCLRSPIEKMLLIIHAYDTNEKDILCGRQRQARFYFYQKHLRITLYSKYI